MSAVVRPARPGDTAVVRDVVTQAFGAEGASVAALVDDLRATHGRVELVAEEGGDVVGHVLLSRSWVDARRALVEVLVLSPLSVTPDRQGRGVGRALVAGALEEARRLGTSAVFLEGDPGYYGRLGFRPATSLGFTRPSTRIPEPAFQVVVLAGE